jgi:hypothetical protein
MQKFIYLTGDIPMAKLKSPYLPIIYVRGYAMTPKEVADTVSTPYMGFNLGSTKLRQAWDGQVQRHIFESPLVRLMKDYGYRDIYADGSEIHGPLAGKSIIIYRYYETADQDLGDGHPLSILEAAAGLKNLILQIRRQVAGDNRETFREFKVYLVAHSMGGLVCRCFLQNDTISTPAERQLVAKVFTYATPHNGIELAGINVPAAFSLWDLHNFNRREMAKYLDLKGSLPRVDSLDGKFDPQRFFCFVGTNHHDYQVAFGLSRKLAGEMSDGLVGIENATVKGAPRAFAYRSHSGPYGVVNSEEGYQNLVRFLFGNLRVDGVMEIEALPLPPSVQKAKEQGRQIRASYYFEATIAPRGAASFTLSERRRSTYSAVLRGFDELLNLDRAGRETPRSPVLFSTFLDSRKVTVGRTVVFSLELAVSTTGYTIDNQLWLDQHLPGEYLFRDTLVVKVTPSRNSWTVRCLGADEAWGESAGTPVPEDEQGYLIPLSSGKGFKACLRLQIHRTG